MAKRTNTNNFFNQKGGVTPKSKSDAKPADEDSAVVKEEKIPVSEKEAAKNEAAPAADPPKKAESDTVKEEKKATEAKKEKKREEVDDMTAILLGKESTKKGRGISRTFYIDADINDIIKKYGGENPSKYVNTALRKVFQSLKLL